jgi:phosphopantetheinyl transferase (holo-ACP synthase)
MPKATDYWEDEFYRQHFTRQEIAYALLQLAPRESFAAMWCAKEALRKADARWAETDWHLTEVAHGPTGKPALISQGEAIPCSVSLSHTSDFAIAVVAMAESRMSAVSHPEQASLPPTQAQLALSPAPGKLSVMLSAAAILVSLLTLGIVFFR